MSPESHVFVNRRSMKINAILLPFIVRFLTVPMSQRQRAHLPHCIDALAPDLLPKPKLAESAHRDIHTYSPVVLAHLLLAWQGCQNVKTRRKENYDNLHASSIARLPKQMQLDI